MAYSTVTAVSGVVLNLGPAFLLLSAMSACQKARDPASTARPSIALDPARMARIGSVSDRYQSYNVEMREVTGGKFWAPYGDAGAPKENLYQFRPPIDLTNPRLRKLAAALGPAYVRVSGTWANSTYFPDSDDAPSAPPPGFVGVLSRQKWRAVIDFAKAVDAELVTSFAINAGTRDPGGAWTPAQAERVVAYTKSIGGRIAAAEFMNEPNLAAHGGAPPGYDAAAYGRDFRAFRAFARQAAPDMLILGPGSSGEKADDTAPAPPGMLKSVDILAAAGPGLDVFSYHHYGALSQRCASIGQQTSVDDALTEQWLARTDAALASYRTMRDRFEPGKPIWNTETADAACGGNPWAGTFIDTFRYLDQLARLAKQGVAVVMHNTLVASDYGMLDDHTLVPKPKYWGALLWRKLMGTSVLESGVAVREGLHLYAHSLRGVPGGVALLAINNAKTAPQAIALPLPSERYTLSVTDLQARTVELNGTPLALGAHDEIPNLEGVPTLAGEVTLAPASISFFAVRTAENGACR